MLYWTRLLYSVLGFECSIPDDADLQEPRQAPRPRAGSDGAAAERDRHRPGPAGGVPPPAPGAAQVAEARGDDPERRGLERDRGDHGSDRARDRARGAEDDPGEPLGAGHAG